MKAKTIPLFLFVFLSFQFHAQDLLPFVENFSKSNYQGDNQIWNVAQGVDDAMYFANNYNLLRYDGVKWEKYSLPNKTIIRSIMVDGERIYSGSYKEFGYWFRKEGKMHYVSLSNNTIVFDDNNNEEIWKIIKFKGRIYFQSFNSLFVFDGKKIKQIKFPFLASYCFIVKDELLIAAVDQGVFKVNKGVVEKVNEWAALENKVIHSIQDYKDKLYFFTKKNGVFVSDKTGVKAWENPLNNTFKSVNINVAQFFKNDKLVIGTASKGVFIFDLKKGTYYNINRNNVLMNNSILSIGNDKEGDLWLGLDNGIAHIEINSPVAIFYDSSGVLGSVYSVASIPNGYLMASNHGVYKYVDKKLSLIPNSEGQVWNISKINSKYIIGHNEGTFIYENDSFFKLSDINGGWNMTKSGVNNSFIEATYNGVVIYNNAIDLANKILVKGLQKPIKYVAQNRKNEIWAADVNRGLYRVLYNDAFETLKVENVTQKNKIANDFGIKMLEFRHEILFLIHQQWYTYNSISNQLEKSNLFNVNFENVSDIVSVDEDNFIVLKDGLLYHVFADENTFIWNLIQEKYYRGRIINDNLKVFKDDRSFLLNLDDGFIKLEHKYKQRKRLSPTIKVEAINGDEFIQNKSKIAFNSELKLNVITGIYGANKPNLFYKINTSNRYIPINEGTILFNNQESGDYLVTIFSFDGVNYSKVSDFSYEVANPWYFSFWMIVLYLVVISLILYVYYRWNKMRYIQKLALREEELKHQKAILEMELKAENELNMQEYAKHILELELQSKSSEVAGKSLSIAKQGEMIEKIQSILDLETDSNKLRSEIKKAIKINAVNKHEWEIFETNLNQIHNDFITNLSKKYPNLTPKDIKLCIYLKMNLSSKEIAPLMNISYRGVELHRYRLRKKLNLAQDENLSKFLIMI